MRGPADGVHRAVHFRSGYGRGSCSAASSARDSRLQAMSPESRPARTSSRWSSSAVRVRTMSPASSRTTRGKKAAPALSSPSGCAAVWPGPRAPAPRHGPAIYTLGGHWLQPSLPSHACFQTPLPDPELQQADDGQRQLQQRCHAMDQIMLRRLVRVERQDRQRQRQHREYHSHEHHSAQDARNHEQPTAPEGQSRSKENGQYSVTDVSVRAGNRRPTELSNIMNHRADDREDYGNGHLPSRQPEAFPVRHSSFLPRAALPKGPRRPRIRPTAGPSRRSRNSSHRPHPAMSG